MRKMTVVILAFVLTLSSSGSAKAEQPASESQPQWDMLNAEEKVIADRILAHWSTWVPAKKEKGTAPLMRFDELYAGLRQEEIAFLDRIRSINPKKAFNFQGDHLGTDETEKFIKLDDQVYIKNGEQKKIEPQYLPKKVYAAYQQMMGSMKEDLGKTLLVESGYRSPAYQLYTYLFYLPKHHYSLVETGHWVALPGYSEHGAPHRQALDFINEQGINGEDNPEEFEALEEYRWLQENAGKFGFELSYPRGTKGITFEPWHWRYVGK